MKRMKLKLTGGTAAVVAVIGGGAALAADRPSPKGESEETPRTRLVSGGTIAEI